MDTSAWYSLSDRSDVNHGLAWAFLRAPSRFGQRHFISSDYVLSETYTLLRMRLGLPAVEAFLSLVARRRNLAVEWIEAGRHAAGLRMMLDRRDKRWSHVDCTSFSLMHELGIRDAFAFDQNFAQAGFRVHP